jgi:hypothetical protein
MRFHQRAYEDPGGPVLELEAVCPSSTLSLQAQEAELAQICKL